MFILLVISMMPKSISDPLDLISTCDRAISGVISPNLYHLTSRHFLHFSVFPAHSVYNTPCSTLVLVPLLNTSVLCALLQHSSLWCAALALVTSAFCLTYLHYNLILSPYINS